jgi:hypothetical protein
MLLLSNNMKNEKEYNPLTKGPDQNWEEAHSYLKELTRGPNTRLPFEGKKISIESKVEKVPFDQLIKLIKENVESEGEVNINLSYKKVGSFSSGGQDVEKIIDYGGYYSTSMLYNLENSEIDEIPEITEKNLRSILGPPYSLTRDGSKIKIK